MVFQQNLLEKAYFIAKMSVPAMVRPASSDFWKAPLERNTPGIVVRMCKILSKNDYGNHSKSSR